jgi:hypothetical protein
MATADTFFLILSFFARLFPYDQLARAVTRYWTRTRHELDKFTPFPRPGTTATDRSPGINGPFGLHLARPMGRPAPAARPRPATDLACCSAT